MNPAEHELVRAFGARRLPLHPTLREMLDEHCSHRTERRGCGLTQASRFLADLVNSERRGDHALDLDLFADPPSALASQAGAAARAAGWSAGWRRLDRAPDALRAGLPCADVVAWLSAVAPAVADIGSGLERDESRLVCAMIADLLDAESHGSPVLPPMPEKPRIGSCSQAEEFFLEIAHGRVRRGGSVNIVVDAMSRPVLVEKMNLGESHSAISLRPLSLNDVRLPPGSLFALAHSDRAQPRATPSGTRMTLQDVAEARFLRITTLSVEPHIRHRAFSAQIDSQLRYNMVSPLTTSLQDLIGFADRTLEQAA